MDAVPAAKNALDRCVGLRVAWTYDTAARITDEAESCYSRQDQQCVERLLVQWGLEPDYIIVFNPPGPSSLQAEMAAHYPVAFQNSAAVVFLHSGAG